MTTQMHANMNGLSGLINMGNTCYMNSAIQAFSHNYLFTDYIFKNEENIKKTLLQNAPKILKDNDQFSLNKDTIIKQQLKEKIKSPNYDYTTLTEEEKNIIYNQTITFQLLRLLKEMWKCNASYVPTCFKHIFSNYRNKFFSGNNQHDAEEAYSCILQNMHNELSQKVSIDLKINNPDTVVFVNIKRKLNDMFKTAVTKEEKHNILIENKKLMYKMKDNAIDHAGLIQMTNELQDSYSGLTTIFTGFLRSSLNCCRRECMYSSNKFEPFNHLALPIPNKQNINLLDCINEYCKEEVLDDNNKWCCDSCGNECNAVKKYQLWKIPPVLVLQLKRFSQFPLRKNNSFVKYPKDGLNIKNYVSHIQYYNEQCYEYRLQTIIAHTGGVHGGHYYTITLDDDTGKWIIFNDNSVVILNDDSDIIVSEAYILIYMNKKQLITTDNQTNKNDYI